MHNFVLGFVCAWFLFSATGREVAAIVYKYSTAGLTEIEKITKELPLPEPTKP